MKVKLSQLDHWRRQTENDEAERIKDYEKFTDAEKKAFVHGVGRGFIECYNTLNFQGIIDRIID